jgi:hypothetical protein
VSWSLAENDAPPSPDQRLILQNAGKSIPEAVIAEIMAKKIGHSVVDMDAYVARAPAPPPMVEDKPVAPADVSKIQPLAAVSATVTAEVHFKPGVTAQLMDSPAGVVYHPDQGTLEWTPPPFSKATEARVLFLLKNPDGSEEPCVQSIPRK